MEKYSYDKNNGLWYELHGDNYLPCLVVSPEEKQTIGIWGRKRQQYLKEYRPVLYSKLVLNGRLHSYLVGIDDQARNRLSLLSTHLAKEEGVNEQLKERDQMAYEQHSQPRGRNDPRRLDLWGGLNMRLLEELWYGNIEPTEYNTNACAEYKEALRLIAKNEEKLRATLTDEQKEIFSRYIDAVQDYQTIAECLLFQSSFKLGARMVAEVMVE